MKSPEQQIREERSVIDQLDRDLIRILKERMDAVEAVARSKSHDPGTSLFDADRESHITRAWAEESARQGLSNDFTGRILTEVLDHSRHVQRRWLNKASST